MTALILAGVLLVVGVVFATGVNIAEAVGARWGRAQGRRDIAREERRANQGPPPGMPDRRRRDVGPGGRHRRDDTVAGQVTATGIMRAVRVADDQLPGIPRATRRQIRDAGAGR